MAALKVLLPLISGAMRPTTVSASDWCSRRSVHFSFSRGSLALEEVQKGPGHPGYWRNAAVSGFVPAPLTADDAHDHAIDVPELADAVALDSDPIHSLGQHRDEAKTTSEYSVNISWIYGEMHYHT